MSAIRFGTDGWRGRIADDYTFANLRRCAQGFATYLKRTHGAGHHTVVGYDCRFLSEAFAAAAAEVLAGNGYTVHLTDQATPTPVISFSIPQVQGVGGINITASHNPPADSGFKVRDQYGGAIPPEGLSSIEAFIPAMDSPSHVFHTPLAQALREGSIHWLDPAPAYMAQLEALIDVAPIKASALTVLADVMWGNGSGWLSRILAGGNIQLTEIHAERNPAFPEMLRPEPIPPNVDAGLAAARDMGADCTLFLDGDADRCGFADENAAFVDQLRVYGLLAYYFLEVRGDRGPIVKTLSTSSMLDRLCAHYGVDLHETGVGFKFVAPAMRLSDALLGGEESGGYAFRGHVPERDGILANLYLLDLLVRTGKRPSQLVEELFALVGPHHYARRDVALTGDRQKQEAMARLEAIDIQGLTLGGRTVTELQKTDGYKFKLEDGGWVLIRFSGTEALIRIYTEISDPAMTQSILAEGGALAGV